jgi:AI-2E family transporter
MHLDARLLPVDNGYRIMHAPPSSLHTVPAASQLTDTAQRSAAGPDHIHSHEANSRNAPRKRSTAFHILLHGSSGSCGIRNRRRVPNPGPRHSSRAWPAVPERARRAHPQHPRGDLRPLGGRPGGGGGGQYRTIFWLDNRAGPGPGASCQGLAIPLPPTVPGLAAACLRSPGHSMSAHARASQRSCSGSRPDCSSWCRCSDPSCRLSPAVVVALFMPFRTTVVWAVLFFLAIQRLENNVLAPRISGHAVGLHPLGAMFALLAGF